MILHLSNALTTQRLPTQLKRPDRWKQCHCLQSAQSASLAFCIASKAINCVSEFKPTKKNQKTWYNQLTK